MISPDVAGTPRQKVLTKQVVVRLTPEVHARLMTDCEEQGRTPAQAVRRALDAYLEGEWR